MTDLVSALNMSWFPSVGLVIFGLVFLAVTVRVLRSSRTESAAHAAMPLEDATTPRTHTSPEHTHG